MRRFINILLVLDIVLCTVAICVYLLPSRQTSDNKTLDITQVPDTIAPVNKQERQQMESLISEKPVENASLQAEHKTQDARTVAESSPFYQESSKVLNEKLPETDAKNCHVILNYCEHLRMAYNTKDIEFIRQVFSEKALIIVGQVVREQNSSIQLDQPKEKVKYYVRSKQQYIAHLKQAFDANKTIEARFSNFKIMRHPTVNGIYGVTLRQGYSSDNYSDDGQLFLLWDFRNPSIPMIHVRVWQPISSIQGGDDAIGLGDFNLE